MINHAVSILLVSEDRLVRESLRDLLISKEPITVSFAHSGSSALKIASQENFDIVIADLRLSDIRSSDFLNSIKTHKPETQVIVLSPQDGIDRALESMNVGAFGFLVEPYSPPDVLQLIDRAGAYRESLTEIKRLKGEIKKMSHHAEIVGIHPKIVRVNEIIESAACTDSAVLIQGKSGTGKELAARVIHKRSLRDSPFQAVNCSVFTEAPLEQELFGQERVSSRGVRLTPGRIEAAAGGTLFLDEIDAMTVPVQEKLLRTIEERLFVRPGGTKEIPANFRLMAATTRDLQELVLQKLFLPELYARLQIIVVTLPELAERMSDIPLLVNYFLARYQPSGQAKSVSPAALELLVRYRWPGNVRELMNAVEYGLVMAKGQQIMPADLPEPVQGEPESQLGQTLLSLRETERELILRTLKECHGNKHLAAKLLRIPRSTLYSKIQKHGIMVQEKADRQNVDKNRAAECLQAFIDCEERMPDSFSNPIR